MPPTSPLPRRFRRVAAVVAVASLAAVAPTALGATCGPAPATIGAADVAFVGTMTAVDSTHARARFAVEEVWKGELATEVDVTGAGGVQWADPSMAGARYLVLARVVGSGLQVGSDCNQAFLWDPSMTAERPSTSHPPERQEEGLDVPIPFLVIGGVVLLVAAVSFVAFRPRPRAPE